MAVGMEGLDKSALLFDCPIALLRFFLAFSLLSFRSPMRPCIHPLTISTTYTNLIRVSLPYPACLSVWIIPSCRGSRICVFAIFTSLTKKK